MSPNSEYNNDFFDEIILKGRLDKLREKIKESEELTPYIKENKILFKEIHGQPDKIESPVRKIEPIKKDESKTSFAKMSVSTVLFVSGKVKARAKLVCRSLFDVFIWFLVLIGILIDEKDK